MPLMILAIVVLAVAPFHPGEALSAQSMRVGASANDTTRRPLTVSSVAGCYDLSRTAWYGLPRQRGYGIGWPDSLSTPGDTSYWREREPPRHVRLLPAYAGGPSTAQGHVLEPQGPDQFGRPGHAHRHWSVAGDSVLAIWSTGFVGVALNLRATSFGLEGTAVALSDIVGPFPKLAARVTLLRTRCFD